MKNNNVVSDKITGVVLLVTAVICFSFSSFHHGWSSYDQKKELKHTGEILKYSYDNPHGIIQLKVDNQTWTVVLAPPSRMQDRGLTEDMLKEGTKATVVGYPHLTVKDEMRAERITVGEKTTELR
jgi:hypothetical protein